MKSVGGMLCVASHVLPSFPAASARVSQGEKWCGGSFFLGGIFIFPNNAFVISFFFFFFGQIWLSIHVYNSFAPGR